jgi:hypothetical protein
VGGDEALGVRLVGERYEVAVAEELTRAPVTERDRRLARSEHRAGEGAHDVEQRGHAATVTDTCEQVVSLR